MFVASPSAPEGMKCIMLDDGSINESAESQLYLMLLMDFIVNSHQLRVTPARFD